MTLSSLLCCFMAKHPDWREQLAERHIEFKEETPYVIFNYGIGADFHSVLVQEARGIIINYETFDVACWPFRKFGNWDSDYADHIDWSTAEVQEKIDGSIVKLWYDMENECWRWSTNSMIDATKALIGHPADGPALSFMDIISMAANYNVLRQMADIFELDASRTYIFELVSPQTQVVLRYSIPYLYLIGVRDNSSGMEYSPTEALPGFARPRTYPITSFDECLAAAKELNSKHNALEHEGFVVVDADFHRIKVKTPEYVAMHHSIENGRPSTERMIQVLRGNVPADTLCKDFPLLARVVRFYQWQVEEVTYGAHRICDVVASMKVSGASRKDIALAIKDDNFAYVGFKYLDTGDAADKILADMPIRKYAKYVKDYGFLADVI